MGRTICIAVSVFLCSSVIAGAGGGIGTLRTSPSEKGGSLPAGSFQEFLLAMGRKPQKNEYEPIVNALGMKFIWISTTEFLMGSQPGEPGRDPEEVLHRVTLTKGFFIQTTELTQGQWQAVMGENPSKFLNGGLDCPVENVSWNAVQAFISRLNQQEGADIYRLPTEAEWEHACRAGTRSPFSCGACLSVDFANYQGNYPLAGCAKGIFRRKPIPVASLSPNAWGIFDMHGNVAEWCQDRYGTYLPNTLTDPTGPPEGAYQVIRGGAWRNGARLCRSAARTKGPPNVKSDMLGFRLVRNELRR